MQGFGVLRFWGLGSGFQAWAVGFRDWGFGFATTSVQFMTEVVLVNVADDGT